MHSITNDIEDSICACANKLIECLVKDDVLVVCVTGRSCRVSP